MCIVSFLKSFHDAGKIELDRDEKTENREFWALNFGYNWA